MVLAVPKRLRPYLLYHRDLLGNLSRIAARTITAFIRTTVGERGLSVGPAAGLPVGALHNAHTRTLDENAA